MTSSERMRALTLRQPWGFAVAHGPKRVENRSWPPPPWLSEVAIHAGARSGWDDDGEFSPLVIGAWREHVAAMLPLTVALPYPRRESLLIDFGAIVAVATVSGCHHWVECGHERLSLRCSPWAVAHQFHWQLSDVRTLARPVPCPGKQRLWFLPPEVEAAVREQIGDRS